LHKRVSDYRISASVEKNILNISAILRAVPVWKNLKNADGYRMSIVVLFADFTENKLEKTVVSGSVTGFGSAFSPLNVINEIPEFAKEYAILLMVDACEKGKPVDQHNSKGARVVKVGVVNQLTFNSQQNQKYG